jgi:hypothetical protein
VSILSVKTYLAAQGATISLTGTIWQSVQSFRQRPKRGKAGGAVFVVVGRVRRREARATMPRGLAEKESQYEVEVLLYAEHTDEQAGGDHFDALVELACQAYRGTTGNPTLVDAIIGQTSYLMDFGEAIDVEVLPSIYVGENESRVGFQAVLTLPIREVLSPA